MLYSACLSLVAISQRNHESSRKHYLYEILIIINGYVFNLWYLWQEDARLSRFLLYVWRLLLFRKLSSSKTCQTMAEILMFYITCTWYGIFYYFSLDIEPFYTTDRPLENMMSRPASSVRLVTWLSSIHDKNNKRLKSRIGEVYSCEDFTTM